MEEIQQALKDLLDYSVDDRELALAEFVHSYADTSGDGVLRLEDLEIFCDEMEDKHKQDDWRLSYPRPPKTTASVATEQISAKS